MWWVLPAMLSVYGGMQQYSAGKEMESLAQQQRLLAEKNEVLETKQLEEEMRRQDIQDKQIAGLAKARAASSGVEITHGSASDYLDFIHREQTTEMKWMKSAGESRIRLRKQYAMLDAATLDMQARQQKMGLYTGIIQAFSFAGQGGLFTSAPPAGAAWSGTSYTTSTPGMIT